MQEPNHPDEDVCLLIFSVRGGYNAKAGYTIGLWPEMTAPGSLATRLSGAEGRGVPSLKELNLRERASSHQKFVDFILESIWIVLRVQIRLIGSVLAKLLKAVQNEVDKFLKPRWLEARSRRFSTLTSSRLSFSEICRLNWSRYW